MEENLRQELLAQTRRALDADDWEAVVRIWQPWVERAGELGEYNAWRLLADCYENGFCGVPVDAGRAQVWRGRMEREA